MIDVATKLAGGVGGDNGKGGGRVLLGGLLIVVVLLSIVFVDGHGRDAVGGGRMLLIYDG